MTDTQDFSQEGTGGGILFKDRYRVFPDRPLGAFDSSMAAAFAAQDPKTPQQKLVALVCRTEVPARLDFLDALRPLDRPTLMRALAWGPIDWPPARTRRCCLLYRHPGGGPLLDPITGTCKPMPERALTEKVIAPIIATLRELYSVGTVHRAIRPSNLFLAESGRLVVLGDAAAGPPGSMQPPMYETIENGMCNPLGRGLGNTADDLYALGATLIVLLLGRNPVADVADDQLLGDRIEKGSYAALVHEERLSTETREAIRGLLIDDPEERWTLEDMELWLGGRRLMPPQTKMGRRAVRPFTVGETQCSTTRLLAHALSRQWTLAPQAIRDGDIETWVRRSVGDHDCADAVADALGRKRSSPAQTGQTPDDVTVARVCIALDPAAPIRYKGLAAMPESLGPALIGTYREEGGATCFAEVILGGLPMFWMAVQPDRPEQQMTVARRLEALHPLLTNGGYGTGVERCLYELNRELHCQSPLVEREFVVKLDELLPALEVAASSTDVNLPMDRHIAAFVACHFRREGEQLVAALDNQQDKAEVAFAALRVLTHLQWRLGPPHLPGLTQWLGGLLPPIADTFHSRALRDQVKRRVARAAKTGSLIELLNAVDAPGERQVDAARFDAAAAEYGAAEAEIALLRRREENRDLLALFMGQRVAATVSLFVAVAATLTVLYMIGP